MKRILMHGVNHVGLGHLNRVKTIASWLETSIPDLQIIMLTEGYGGQYFKDTTWPCISIPAYQESSLSPWTAISSDACEKLTHSITNNVLEMCKPDLVVYDTVLRSAVWGAVESHAIHQVYIARLGELFKAQIATLPRLPQLEALIVPHDIQAATEYQSLLAQFERPIIYAGTIINPDHIEPIQPSSTDEHPLIVVTLGGGGWETGQAVLRAVSEVCDQILLLNPCPHIIVITGPYYAGPVIPCRPPITQIVPFVQDIRSLMAKAALIICMAGYNTLNEVLFSGTPTICFPATEADDQLKRADEYTSRYPQIIRGSYRELISQIKQGLQSPKNTLEHQTLTEQVYQTARTIVKTFNYLLNQVEVKKFGHRALPPTDNRTHNLASDPATCGHGEVGQGNTIMLSKECTS